MLTSGQLQRRLMNPDNAVIKVKQSITCPYCEAKAHPTKMPSLTPKTHVRYGCTNEHYLAVELKKVLA